MGTEDGARAEGGGCGCLGGRGGAGRGGRGVFYQHHWRRAGGRWTQPLLFLAAGVLIGFYGAVLLHVGGPHRGASGDGGGQGAGALLSRWRDLGEEAPEAAAGGGGSQQQQQGQAMCPPCPACPLRKAAPAPAEGGAAPSGEELKGEWGLDTYGTVDAGEAFQAFWPFLPTNIKETLYPRALVLSTRGSKLAVQNAPGGEIAFEDLKTCKEVDVITLGSDRCYVVTNAKVQTPPFFVHRYKHQSEEDGGWHLVPRIEKEGSNPPLNVNRQKHEAFLLTLLQNYHDLEKAAAALLQKVADPQKRVLVMALNEGDTDMLVNFVCSARAAKIPLDNAVVFAADQATVDVAEALGLAAFTHPAFGKLPSAHAKHYGDAGFLAIMWLKIVAVWLPLRLGYDVFFQDADLVWFKSPWEVFSDPEIDAYFMDDGARSERFAPLFANSGFYYLRSRPMVQHFMQTVLFSYDMIVQYASHQTLVIQALHEHIARNGLRVRILDYTDFAGGQVFHHRKELMEKIRRREYVPYTFHMCWTQTKNDKLRNMQDATLWFLGNACNGSVAAVAALRDRQLGVDACCVDPMAAAAQQRR